MDRPYGAERQAGKQDKARASTPDPQATVMKMADGVSARLTMLEGKRPSSTARAEFCRDIDIAILASEQNLDGLRNQAGRNDDRAGWFFR